MNERITERLKKIAALASSGVEGERENAQELLKELCAKHGVSAETLTEQKKDWFSFRVDGEFEKGIFTQTIIMVCQTSKIRNRPPKKGTKTWNIEVTLAQSLDIKEAFSHFRKAWEKEAENVLTAFIHANRIYGPSTESDEGPELSPEEAARIKRISAMAMMMPRTPWKNLTKID